MGVKPRNGISTLCLHFDIKSNSVSFPGIIPLSTSASNRLEFRFSIIASNCVRMFWMHLIDSVLNITTILRHNIQQHSDSILSDITLVQNISHLKQQRNAKVDKRKMNARHHKLHEIEYEIKEKLVSGTFFSKEPILNTIDIPQRIDTIKSIQTVENKF